MRMLSHHEPHNVFEEIRNELQDFLRAEGVDIHRSAMTKRGLHIAGVYTWMTCQPEGIMVYTEDSGALVFPYEDPQQFEKVLKAIRGCHG